MANDVVRRLEETMTAIRSRSSLPPRVGLVLGSGLGGFAEKLRNVTKLPYRDLPHVPEVAGFEGALHLGSVDDVPIACLDGRAHLYEGFQAWEVVHGVRCLARLGVRAALVTNAAGAIDATWTVGSMMVVTDHLDFTACDPLVGLGALAVTPYPDMRAAYDETLRNELHAAAHAESQLSARIRPNATPIELEEGIYAALRDPSCETPAQVKMLHALGAHTVGMSTVPEVVALRQLGVRVAALSYVTHHAAGVKDGTIEDEATSRLSLTAFHRVVRAWVLHADRA